MFLNHILVQGWSKMLGFRDFWKKKKNNKNFWLDTSGNLPVWVIEPPFPVEVEPENEPTPENDVPTQVSGYISDKYSGR